MQPIKKNPIYRWCKLPFAANLKYIMKINPRKKLTTEPKGRFNPKFYWLLGGLSFLALIKVLIIVYFPTDLHSEEAQYWVWSKHLQLSYYSKPPLIAYLNRFSTLIFGDTVFGIRINAIVIAFLFSLVTYFLAFEIFKNINTAVVASLLTCIFPFLISISVYFSTDTPLLLFWICAMLCFWKATETPKVLWWVLFGISVGLGALSKYSMFLIYIPLLLYAAKYHREIFRTLNFYLSILIALLLFSPVIYWNIRQGGLGLLHVVHLAGANNHTHTFAKALSNVMEFALGQFAILLPFYQYGKMYRKFRQKSLTKEEVFLFLPAICMFLIFTTVAFIRNSGAYINWVMFAYTGIPVLFAHFAISDNQLKFSFRTSVMVISGLLLFVLLASSWNTVLPLGKSNPANKVVGWSQLATKIDRMKDTLPTKESYVFSPNYHIASEMWFYLKKQPETYVLNLNSRMTQFDLWPGIEQFSNSDKTGIFVDGQKITPEIRNGFSEVIKEDSCLIFNQHQHIETYYIYLLKGLKGFQKHITSY